MNRWGRWRTGWLSLLALGLASCSSVSVLAPVADVQDRKVLTSEPTSALSTQHDTLLRTLLEWDQTQPLRVAQVQVGTRWEPQQWRSFPRHSREGLLGVWPEWQAVCSHPTQVRSATCQQGQELQKKTDDERLTWLLTQWQPMRVLNISGSAEPGLLTGYYEPHMKARRLPDSEHQVALYATPDGWRSQPGQIWFSRAEAEQDPRAQQALQGKALVWMRDPIDALILQIQGSGRLDVQEPDGSVRTVRLAFAGHNGHPYRSVAKPLLDSGKIAAGSWEHMRAWAAQQDIQTVKSWIHSNPRLVFFKEVPLLNLEQGPVGAHATPLWPGRSIAVDRNSILLGQPVWLSSIGPQTSLNKLVMAQDTGAAIVGAVRADYFAGWGDEAYQLASRLKQPLSLWTLVPRAP